MEVDEQVDMALERIDTEVQTTPDIESVELLVDRTSKSEQGCIVCGVGKGVKRYRLTDVQRGLVFLIKGIFLPPGSRCCKIHLYNKQLTYEALRAIKGSMSSVER
ncbi:unnamed protein product [Rotaria magnacalcarata]|uniref:Uncharacterized protein n=1 Tax=Rotaria magnacalcarata TaxID=392030 RepID=A0A816P9S9_9BILA|nr:unnamed protein product [Rotaria magnacalcarata]